jgi:hypothetical protein
VKHLLLYPCRVFAICFAVFDTAYTSPIVSSLAFGAFRGSAKRTTARSAHKQLCKGIFRAVLSLLGNSRIEFLSLIISSRKLGLYQIEGVTVDDGRVIVGDQIPRHFAAIDLCFFADTIGTESLLITSDETVITQIMRNFKMTLTILYGN